MPKPSVIVATLLLLASASAHAQSPAEYRASECPSCAAWNAPQDPMRIHGNSWYVGTRGLSAILVTSPSGHVLIDAGLPESAPLIAANIRKLGFRVEDIRVILNSHAHYDHAGGIAEIQRMSGARVLVHPWSAATIRTGKPMPEDPQREVALPYPSTANVHAIRDRDSVRVGNVMFTAHFTGGHTPGGTTWTWRSCEGAQCVDVVYADSHTPVSSDEFLFTRNTRYAHVLTDFEKSFLRLEQMPCDVLLTPHPGASRMFEWIGKTAVHPRSGNSESACRVYVADARKRLAERVTRETSANR